MPRIALDSGLLVPSFMASMRWNFALTPASFFQVKPAWKKTARAAGRPTVFGARLTSPNSLEWLHIPFDQPGGSGNHVLRIVNVRANASQLGLGSGMIPRSCPCPFAWVNHRR